ncbi:MAG: exo-alpha-sialidase [Chloroflexi bacterium]|nr:MAG: exo-alpha-sialidase [Chloroflexota bacterium]
MEIHVFLATEAGVYRLEKQGNHLSQTGRYLDDQEITCLAVTGDIILAGTHNGIYRSEDGAATWQKLNDSSGDLYLRWIAVHNGGRYTVFAGTEPAAIYVSNDNGGAWQERPEVARLRDKHGWFLPYSNGAGCVRGFAFHGQRGYAAVEVGGVLRTDNGGVLWQLAPGSSGNPSMGGVNEPGMIHPDVHSIYTHPYSADLVCAPTGGGFYLSPDGGQNWKLLYDCYCRAAWWNPENPDHLLLGSADGVERMGRIEESLDRGRTWNPASEGMQTPWTRHMVERFVPMKGDLFAVLSNGELWFSQGNRFVWNEVEVGARVNAAASA